MEADYALDRYAPAYRMVDLRHDSEEVVRRDGDLVHVQHRKGGHVRLKTLRLTPGRDLVVGPGFNEYVAAHWDTLLAGQTLVCDFVIPSRLQLVAFRIKHAPGRQSAGGHWFVVSVDNMLLRLLAPQLQVEYRPAHTRAALLRRPVQRHRRTQPAAERRHPVPGHRRDQPNGSDRIERSALSVTRHQTREVYSHPARSPPRVAVPSMSSASRMPSGPVASSSPWFSPAVEAWLPKSVLSLRGYSVQTLVSDLVAGVTVGLVALPLAMAFAISSGLPPQAGIYCAIVTGFLISALGGSR